jgi:hypothetical protein
MFAQVFISYAARDEPLARRVEDALERRGIPTWSAYRLAVGADWTADIRTALEKAAVVIVLVTPDSLASQWVTYEWSTALAQSKRVIPVLSGGASFADLKGPLAAVQAVILDADFDAGITRIVQAIASLRQSSEPPPSEYVDLNGIVEDAVERKLASMGLVGTPRRQARERENPRLVFVIASFAEDMEPAFEAVEAAAKAVDLDAYRVRDIPGDYRITDTILSEIERARFVVADLTHERPNVYFELGYARGLGKRVITIKRAGARAHFDVQDWTYLEYADSRPLERDLIERFRFELGLA